VLQKPSLFSLQATMTEQLEVALLLGGGLSAAGFVRVYLTNGSLLNAFAISVSLLAIVTASVLLGTGLPFALARGGVDPAHAGTSIQVIMVQRVPSCGESIYLQQPPPPKGG
jgi:Mg/Co/Ni transporter MgtE